MGYFSKIDEKQNSCNKGSEKEAGSPNKISKFQSTEMLRNFFFLCKLEQILIVRSISEGMQQEKWLKKKQNEFAQRKEPDLIILM